MAFKHNGTIPSSASQKGLEIGSGRGAIDQFVGRQIQARRVELDLAQSDIADGIGTSPEKIDAYERGIDRIAPDHLVELARILGVGLNFFFNGT